MTTHLGVMVLFAFLVAAVFATLMRDAPREQLRLGARIFSGLALGAYVLGWIMFVLFRQTLADVSRWLRLWGPVVFLMAVIFGLSSLPALPDIGRPGTDKAGHVVMYGALALLALRALASSRWTHVRARQAAWAWTICALYGASDELHQGFVAGREMSLGDWAADLIGAAAAVGAGIALAARRRAADREV